MQQTAEFLGAGRQAPVPNTADRGRIVGPHCHRELHTGPVPAFVTQLACPPTEQAGNPTFHHRAAGMTKIGSGSQLELILFLFRVMLCSKERATRRLQGFSQLFPTPGEDRFCRDTCQRRFADVRRGLRSNLP